MFFVRAVSYDTIGDPIQALKDCRIAIQMDPSHVGALNSRGLVQSKLGHWHEALDDFNAAINLAPDWYLPYLNRANVHLNLDDPAAAIADCNHVIESATSAPGGDGNHIAAMAYWNRSQCHRLAGDLDQAEVDLAEAQSREPEFNPETYRS